MLTCGFRHVNKKDLDLMTASSGRTEVAPSNRNRVTKQTRRCHHTPPGHLILDLLLHGRRLTA